jgi:hypothetical protein
MTNKSKNVISRILWIIAIGATAIMILSKVTNYKLGDCSWGLILAPCWGLMLIFGIANINLYFKIKRKQKKNMEELKRRLKMN